MPYIVIDDQHIETQTGKTVIEAAFDNGIDIPHFCWHPELSVSGNCRMCLVEIGMPKRNPDGSPEKDANGKPVISYFPKLQIACATQVSDGLHIRTKTDTVITAQESVMEFLLINHPLDCPICDEAGQCKLQEYAFCHSSGESSFVEEKNHKSKRVSWGKTIVYDAERCISCSRCIRFAKEIAKDDVIDFEYRNDHVTIALEPGKTFDSDYSMNVIDICPVGALTSSDFRFKSRVWDMSFNDSICPGCSRGCNIKLGVRNNEVLRIEPKTNPYVNKFWMCDYGRLSNLNKINNNRISESLIKKNGILDKSSWNDALIEAVKELKKFKPNEIMFIGSAHSSNEDNYSLQKFAHQVLKTKNIDFLRHENKKFADDFLCTSDVSPNSIGAKTVGVSPSENISSVGINQLIEKITNENIKALYVMNEDFEDFPEIFKILDKLQLLIIHASNHSLLTQKANIVFAASTFAESEGTFTNINSRVQHFKPAMTTAENLRFMGMKMSRLDKFGSHNDRWSQHEQRHCRSSWRILLQLAEKFGSNWNFKTSEDVFNEITQQVPAFKGMSYDLLDEYFGLILGKSSNPDKKVKIYESNYMKPA